MYSGVLYLSDDFDHMVDEAGLVAEHLIFDKSVEYNIALPAQRELAR